MKRICIITTMWSSINNWIKPFLDDYHDNQIDVTIICNMDEQYENQLRAEFPFVHTKRIMFPRGTSVLGSVKSIFSLWKFFKNVHFDLVQYSTPNASFYASLASKWSRVPVRLYCQWGMVYVTQTGIRRKIFRWMEKTICKCSTMIQPDSFGNLEFCRNEGFYNENNSCVIWNGSAKGLDLNVYDISKKQKYSEEIRGKYAIASSDTVIGFVGRLGREKGCNELFTVFRDIQKAYKNTKLLFVGPIEKEETIEPELLKYFYNCDDIIKTNLVFNVEKYMAAMDLFVLPSHREGFGMSVIEASAMGVPVVVTKYPGPSGAMLEGVTGLSVEIKDIASLEKAIRELLENKDKARRLGMNGREYAVSSYDRRIFAKKYMENRLCLLNETK